MPRIIVNGRPHDAADSHLTYDQVVAIAGTSGHPSVLYRLRLDYDTERSGSLHVGSAPIAIAEDMVFNVQHTGNA